MAWIPIPGHGGTFISGGGSNGEPPFLLEIIVTVLLVIGFIIFMWEVTK